MKKNVAFLTLIGGSALGAVLGNFIILYLFHTGEMSLALMAARFVLPALACAAISFALLGSFARLFTSPDLKGEGEKLFNILKKIGAVPIKSIFIFIFIQAVFLGIIVFLFGKYFGVPRDIPGFLYGACLSAGMAVGTLVYVISDGLVSSTLMSHNITLFPKDLREDRQSLKILVIPVMVALLSIVFTLSVAELSLDKAGIDFSTVGNKVWGITFAVLAFFFIFILLLAVVLKKNSTALFHTILNQLENLSSGKKDLRRRINIISVDELGAIAGMMNTFCENIAQGMKEIKGDQQVLYASSGNLEDNAQGMNAAIERISSAIAQAREKAGSQMLSVGQASAVIRSITQNIESLNDSIAVQAESVSHASSAVEEMVGNIASIGNVTEKMAAHFTSVNNAAREGISIQKDSSERVEKIVAQSQALQAANRIIATISAQTNLLAMNAAIEAAHAGEAGRGFSVVADEIRKLAETSSTESKKINDELKQITRTIDGIVKGAESSAGAFGAVSERVEETEKLVYEVNNAMKEQQIGAERILDALKQMNDITSKVRTGSGAMQEGNNVMLNEISSLQSQSKDISSGMDNITMEISTINSGAAAVSTLAVDTHKTVGKIQTIVDDYEV